MDSSQVRRLLIEMVDREAGSKPLTDARHLCRYHQRYLVVNIVRFIWIMYPQKRKKESKKSSEADIGDVRYIDRYSVS